MIVKSLYISLCQFKVLFKNLFRNKISFLNFLIFNLNKIDNLKCNLCYKLIKKKTKTLQYLEVHLNYYYTKYIFR